LLSFSCSEGGCSLPKKNNNGTTSEKTENELWKKIMKEETARCKITSFSTQSGEKYPYVILPFDSRISVDFQWAVVEGLSTILEKEIKNSDAILAIEAKGFIPACWIAQKYGKDLIIVRKRDYKIPSQIKIEQMKAYGKDILYCVGLKKGLKLMIIEDMISSGGTIIGVAEAIKKYGCKLAGIGSVYERGDGMGQIEKAGYRAKGLARLEIIDNKPVIARFCTEGSNRS